ncbi:MAG TPA: vitamin K epoxide reductase family protein [Gemmatimonadaceae bacterium]|nr:vitamin K epoxide reductase family protein [Gemmatimonadaceae bacterium]
MTKRMLAALVALVGLFVALYMTLYKYGVIGTLNCAVGSCETVQTSRWATLFGFPVAVWGVGFYLSVLALTLVGTHERYGESRAVPLALLVLTGWGVLFSGWLTYLEAAVIKAWCQWCVVSAVLTFVLFVLAWLDWREAGGPRPPAASG